MRTIKILAMLISFSLMSTGCNHDHNHDEHSSKMEKSGHSHGKNEKKDENHRH